MVRTRIAPSPTGFPHIGTIYQVLFDYALAKKNNGQFVLRLEDTDRNRFVEGAEEVIYNALEWFGLNPDESPLKSGPYAPYRQSERLDTYKKHAEELIAKGHAYYCFCTPEEIEVGRKEMQQKTGTPMYNKRCRNLSEEEVKKKLDEKMPHVIRMKVPSDRKIAFNDLILGTIEFDSNVVDDQVILKTDGFPTYHLGVVVDDHLMKITHIIRGREWIPSTPKHILLYEFFGWEVPVHAHLPLILNSDGKGKLSKRHGHASVEYYRSLGYLPEVVLNYLSNVVWYHPENKEIYPLQEFIELLDLKKINSAGARFNLEKLDWMNGEYIRMMSDEELLKRLTDFIGEGFDPAIVKMTVPLVKERIKKLSDYIPLTEFLFKSPTTYEVVLSDRTQILEKTAENLSKLEKWEAAKIGDAMMATAQDLGVKNSEYFMTIRVAITGKKISPPLNESMEILGKDESLERLQK